MKKGLPADGHDQATFRPARQLSDAGGGKDTRQLLDGTG
jgi:hypothetical protein